MSPQKPFSQACENNKAPILTHLQDALAGAGRVLEIGSGTGQHAVHFARALPQLQWQCSDRPENLPGIEAWRQEAALDNLPPALTLDVQDETWPAGHFDAVYSANTLHIMSWECVELLFARVGALLPAGGQLIVYGPFNYQNQYTSPSNAQFDVMLRNRDPRSGIRDMASLNTLAASAGLQPSLDHAMPANNRLVIWRKD